MIFGRNTTCDISKLSQRITIYFDISLVVFMPNITTNHTITFTNCIYFCFCQAKTRGLFFFRSKRMNFQWLGIGTPVWERCKSSVLNLLRFKTKFIYSFSILPTKDYKEFNYAFAIIGALRGHKDTRFIGATQIHFNH